MTETGTDDLAQKEPGARVEALPARRLQPLVTVEYHRDTDVTFSHG